jgi:DNA-binding protein H-NS
MSHEHAVTRDSAIVQINTYIAEFGLTRKDLMFPKVQREKLPPIPPKYWDPATGKTWNGRGRSPKWFDGDSPERFLIQRPA